MLRLATYLLDEWITSVKEKLSYRLSVKNFLIRGQQIHDTALIQKDKKGKIIYNRRKAGEDPVPLTKKAPAIANVKLLTTSEQKAILELEDYLNPIH